ncbi:putative gamma-glutamylcyclotransferase CG2811 isoform X2 [Homalodisca vitripennis]|uniref:putative gamma-glutamylcyclotransferase CG2811 isoform X2 n=1 Tax=Homalodisca vitripennis TaxID=197043 RepID=UPI001EECBF9F|nr:putative gamma-glutamylcyclotransferase CG2811 isoform X2 [Homalodisca vitripennis]
MQGKSTMSVTLKVFVYGTLKTGEPNHHWLTKPENGHSKLVGEGMTLVKYPLVIASRYNIPFLLDVPGIGHNVSGEVYEIDEKMLSNLDILEDYPSYYTRRLETIVMKAEGSIQEQCWTYFLNGHKPHLLELPTMASYSSLGDHGLQYMERYRRDPAYDHRLEVIDRALF